MISGQSPVAIGQPVGFSADFFNGLVNSQRNRRFGFGDPPLREPRQFQWLYCKNATQDETPFNRFNAVSIEGVEFTPNNAAVDGSEEHFADTPVMKAHKPDWRKGSLWGLTLEPIQYGFVGRVLIQGICPVKLIGHRHLNVCGPDFTEQTLGTLKTGYGDAQVLWQDIGSDATSEAEHWGLCLLGGNAIEIEGEITDAGEVPDDTDGKDDPQVCKGKVWRYADSQVVDVEQRQMEVINKEIDLINRDESLEPTAGAYFRARWINSEWRVIWVGC